MLQAGTLLGVSLVPRKNRRLLVTGTYLIILLASATIVLTTSAQTRYFQLILNLVFLVPVNVSLYFFGRVVEQSVFPDLRRTPVTLQLSGRPREVGEPDERDLSIRNAAYFTAYRLVATYSLFVCLMVWPAFDSGSTLFPLLLLLPIFVFAPTLPQAVILWSEPDLPEDVGE